MFLKNCWYAAAWTHELEGPGPIGRVIVGEPVVIYRNSAGTPIALADRCAHRHAPLSMGRVEADGLRCMYHGLKFNEGGGCIEGPGLERISPALRVRSFPIVERDSWFWIWMGDAASADPALIPAAWGLDTPEWTMTPGQIDYEANYQLISDNLTDLSHLDFVHETTLSPLTGGDWSKTRPTVTPGDRALHIVRWFENRASPAGGGPQDVYNDYYYSAPGVFIMRSDGFEAGTAARLGFGAPDVSQSRMTILEQQAVTPIDAQRTRYLFATGFARTSAPPDPDAIEKRGRLVAAAFAEDKAMIEAQQRVIALTPPGTPMAPIPQDRGPMLMRSIMTKLMEAEARSGVPA